MIISTKLVVIGGNGTELVLGPAEDGGYVLIGVNKSYPELFEGIEWGR